MTLLTPAWELASRELGGKRGHLQVNAGTSVMAQITLKETACCIVVGLQLKTGASEVLDGACAVAAPCLLARETRKEGRCQCQPPLSPTNKRGATNCQSVGERHFNDYYGGHWLFTLNSSRVPLQFMEA